MKVNVKEIKKVRKLEWKFPIAVSWGENRYLLGIRGKDEECYYALDLNTGKIKGGYSEDEITEFWEREVINVLECDITLKEI